MAGCNTTIADITKECKKRYAPGTLQRIYATGYLEIATIPAPTADTHKVESDITFRAADGAATPPVDAGSFAAWDVSRREQQFETEMDENGQHITTAQFFIPGQTAERAVILNNLGEDANVFIIPDKEGNNRIVGAIDNPADVRVREQYTPTNGYILTITWESGHTPYFYTGAITT